MNHILIPKFSFSILILLLLGACQNTDSGTHIACNKDDVNTPFLISVQEAKDKIDQDSSIIVVEVSKKQEYKKGHLPKAVNIWRSDFQINQQDGTRGLRCSADTLQSLLQDLGVNDHSFLIVYDAKGSCDALRLAWVLDFYGFENYAIMNGGKKSWSGQDYEISFEAYQPLENPDYILKPKKNEAVLATMSDVRSAIDDPNTIIIDTREDYEYNGSCFVSKGELFEFKKGAFSRGCIPSAVHLNWSELSDLSNDHRIKCKKDLLHDLNQKGITKDKNVIVYCHSGARSSHTYFVLKKVLDFQNVKNYDGSWIEWSHLASTDDTYPIDLRVGEDEFKKELDKKKLELQQNTVNTTK